MILIFFSAEADIQQVKIGLKPVLFLWSKETTFCIQSLD